MPYEIIKDAPIPAGYNNKYPWNEMKVGDAFDAPASERDKLWAAAAYRGKRHNERYTVRKRTDGTYRCWRTK